DDHVHCSVIARIARASIALVLAAACGSPPAASTLRASDGTSLCPPPEVSVANHSPAGGVGGDAGSDGTNDEGTRTSSPSAAPAPTPTQPAPTRSAEPPGEPGISGRVVAGRTCAV